MSDRNRFAMAAALCVGVLLFTGGARASGSAATNGDRIEFDERGGLIKTERREPLFALDPRGRGHVWHRGIRHALDVPPETFSSLVNWIVEEQGFFELLEQDLLQQVRARTKARGSVTRIMDAATTHIRVVYQGRSHEVSYYALDFYARDFPEIPGLKRLSAIAKRLRTEAQNAQPSE